MLKPGQHKLQREYYMDVNTEKPEGNRVLKNYSRFQSISLNQN